MSVDQIINTIYTRIFENDLISQQQREENVERLSNLFVTDKKEIKREVEQVLSRGKDSNRKVFNYLVILLGLLSAVIGVSIVSFDKLVNFNSELNSNILLTMLASVLAIFTSYIFLRFKDNQESSDEKDSPRNLHKVAFRFERDIMRSLKKQNFDITIPNEKDSGFDLYLNNGQKSVGVKIKYWRNRPPFSYIKHLISRIDNAMEKEKISESYIITNDTYDLGQKIKFDKNISIVTINELKNKLR
ncbi:hypothetical protein PG913_08635 [Tenacibaculum pacificus]|uniref:hypothetical protein n=1 Tax=Tenacibaculum pacificus TaxID=3018314 RepID=UPI0022F3E649|nr:hypothetical protein [Tenacibaculum pacificus]WBX72962.1 hypothetical protein PG913_08635 [Tenacibaculum pacificus]